MNKYQTMHILNIIVAIVGPAIGFIKLWPTCKEYNYKKKEKHWRHEQISKYTKPLVAPFTDNTPPSVLMLNYAKDSRLSLDVRNEDERRFLTNAITEKIIQQVPGDKNKYRLFNH